MPKRKRNQPQPVAIRAEISLKDSPVPVQPGDQLYFGMTSTGPQVTRIVREGVQIWPALKPD